MREMFKDKVHFMLPANGGSWVNEISSWEYAKANVRIKVDGGFTVR